jgi:hypothetical protein
MIIFSGSSTGTEIPLEDCTSIQSFNKEGATINNDFINYVFPTDYLTQIFTPSFQFTSNQEEPSNIIPILIGSIVGGLVFLGILGF